MKTRSATLATIMKRCLRKRCPRCGKGCLFEHWYTLFDRCRDCAYRYESSAGDTWAFMYMTTAALTGFIVIAMFTLHPSNTWLGLTFVMLAAVSVIAGTLPLRKSIAIALEYIISVQFDHQHADEKAEQTHDAPHSARGTNDKASFI